MSSQKKRKEKERLLLSQAQLWCLYGKLFEDRMIWQKYFQSLLMYEQEEGNGPLSNVIDRSPKFGSTLLILFLFTFFDSLLPSPFLDLGCSVTFGHLSFHQSLRIKKKLTQLCNNDRLPLPCFLAPSIVGSSSITSLAHCLHCQNMFSF